MRFIGRFLIGIILCSQAFAGSQSWLFSGGCSWPSTVAAKIRFKGGTSTGSGASLSVTNLGSICSNATVPGGVNAPTIVTNVLNGKSVIRFSAASSQYLTYGANCEVFDKDTAHDVILVHKSDGQTAAAGIEVVFGYCTDDGVTKKQEIFASANLATYKDWYWGGGDGTGLNTGIAGYDYYSAFAYFLGRFNGAGTFVSAANWTEEKNGSAQTDAGDTGGVNTNTCPNLIGAYTAGTVLPFDGDIAELAVVPAMSAGEKTDMRAYIACEYGL